MSRKDRAKQFAPFEALRGLREALRIKEFEHEKVQKGELSEEDAMHISKILMDFKKNSNVRITYFENGHYYDVEGVANLRLEENIIIVNNQNIILDNIHNLVII